MPRNVWTLLRDAAVEWYNDNTFRLSAALAFYTIFSMAPILLIAVAVAGVWFDQATTQRHVLREIEGLVGAEGARAVAPVLARVQPESQSVWAAVIGFVLLGIGSTAVFAELQSALNWIWDVQANPRRGYLRSLVVDRLESFAIVLGVGFLLLVSLVMSAAISAAQEFLEGRVQTVSLIWRTLHLVTSYLMTAGLFALIYRFLPDVKLTWRDVGIGALTTAALFTAGKHLIGLYIGRTAFASDYGAAGSFVVLLIWVYYSALISFFGAEFTHVYARRFGSQIRPEPHAERVGRKDEPVED